MLFIFIGGIEAVLRLAEIDLYKKNQFFPINRDIDFPEVYKKDQNLFWRFRTDQLIDSKSFSNITYRINSDGMRGDEILNEKKGLRILAIGNSCTFGWGVRQEEIWTTKLKNELSKTIPNKNIEIINCGVPGYSSHQGRKYFEQELLKYKPDIILVMFGWNDQWTAGKNISDAEQEAPNIIIISLQNIFSKLKIYQLFRKIILSTTEKEQVIPLDQVTGKRRVSQKEFFLNLRSIVKTAKENSITAILMVPPVASIENYFPEKTSRFHKNHLSYQQQVISAAKYEDILFVDHQLTFDKYDDLFSNPSDDPIHFNSKGHSVFTDAVKETLIPIIQ